MKITHLTLHVLIIMISVLWENISTEESRETAITATAHSEHVTGQQTTVRHLKDGDHANRSNEFFSPPTGDNRPTTVDIIKEAIRSAPDKCMSVRAIKKYVLKNFPWFPKTKLKWEDSVSGTLSSMKGRPFVRRIIPRGSSQKESCWTMITDDQLLEPEQATTRINQSSRTAVTTFPYNKLERGAVEKDVGKEDADDTEEVLHGSLENVEKNKVSVNPIVTSHSFAEVITSKQFIDKSLFIEWFLTQKSSLYVTGPSKFGKSTLLSMLHHFLQAEFHENGTKKHSRETKAYEMFVAPQRYDGSREPLLIFQKNQTFFNMHFKNYIVLRMEFQDLGLFETKKSFDHGLYNMVDSMIDNFQLSTVIPNNANCSKLQLFLRLYNRRSMAGIPTGIYVTRNRMKKFLSYLNRCFEQNVIITVDEYDTPLHSVLGTKIDQDTINLIVRDMHTFMNIVSKNDIVRQVFCVGGLNLGGLVSLYANHIRHVDFTMNKYVPKYVGLLETEVNELLDRFSLSQHKQLIKEYYDGYRVFGTGINHVYNMGSILTCISEEYIAPFFFKVSSWHDIFDDLFADASFGDRILEATGSHAEMITIGYVVEGANYKQINDIRRLVRSGIVRGGTFGLSTMQMDYVLQYFLEAGYFTMVAGIENVVRVLDAKKNLTEDPQDSVVPVGIIGTNLEIRGVMRRKLYRTEFCKNYFGTTDEDIEEFKEAVNRIDSKDEFTFMRLLKSVRSLFHRDLSREEHVQVPVYYVAVQLALSKRFKAANYERVIEATKYDKSTGKVYDLLLINNNGIGFVFEFEYSSDAFHGLEQAIRDKHHLGLKEGYFRNITYSEVIVGGLQCTAKRQCSMCYVKGSRSVKNAKCIVYPANDNLARKLNRKILKRQQIGG